MTDNVPQDLYQAMMLENVPAFLGSFEKDSPRFNQPTVCLPLRDDGAKRKVEGLKGKVRGIERVRRWENVRFVECKLQCETDVEYINCEFHCTEISAQGRLRLDGCNSVLRITNPVFTQGFESV